MKRRNTRRSKKPEEKKEYRNRRDMPENGSEEYRGAGRNDVSWYTRNPNLSIAAGSFPFPYRPGMTIPFGTVTNTTMPTETKPVSDSVEMEIPGVMVMDWIPSVGYSQKATDPASILAKEIYAKVRREYSGSIEADAPDFVVYLMALDSIFSYIAWLKRVYRVMNSWTPENYITPDVLLCGMGFSTKDITNLRQNRVQFWQVINELVLQSRKFTCPALMDIFNRHYWMSDNIYTDAAEINSQFYMFNLKAVYKFAMLNMPDGNPGPGLQMTLMPNIETGNSVPDETLMTPEIFYNFGRSLIDALVAWDDAYTINGYLMRAFDGAPNFIVDELPSDQPFNPVYEPEVLSQIENSRCIPYGWLNSMDFTSFNITQDVPSNAILSNPSYTTRKGWDPAGTLGSGGYAIKPSLSIRSIQPTVADSIVASRLQATVQLISGTVADGMKFRISAGTEIPLGWYTLSRTVGSKLFVRDYPVQTVISWNDIINNDTTEPKTFKSIIAYIQSAMRLEAYDWHPFTFYFEWGSGGAGNTITRYLTVNGDIHNMTTISAEDLANLHKICVYSELNAFSF